MNDKLAQFAGRSIEPKNRSGGGGAIKRALVSLTKNCRDNNALYVRMSLHHRAIEQLRWQVGDRVRMDITDDGDIVLSRDNSYGSTLSKSNGSKRTNRIHVSFRVVPEFYNAISTGTGRNVEIDAGRIAFCVGQQRED